MKTIDILVVDDERDVYLATKLAMQLLEFEGIKANVSYSDSAASAIEMLTSNDYKLVFLDIIMETIYAGYEVISHIQKNKPNSDVCIFIRSGQPGNIPEEYLSLIKDVDGYLNKTDCTMEKLHDIVKTIA